MNEKPNFDGATKVLTKRLYFDDSYQVEFESRVREIREYSGRPALILEETCFYPEGGGQPCDRGEIEGVRVIEVREEDDQIIHILEGEVKAEKVRGKIDWVRRYDHMQQHSGQHLLSQVCWEILGAETLSFHLGEEDSSIELDLTQFSEEEKKKIETRAAEIIFKNKPIKIYFIDESQSDEIPFRKKPLKSGLIRVVEIDNYDYSACGGTHVRRTGEIGLIKIIGEEKVRQHVRLFFICGFRALKDYQNKEKILIQLAGNLGTSVHQLQVTVDKLQEEARSLRKKCLKLRGEMDQYEAEKLMAEARGLIIDRIYEDRNAEEARNLGLRIIHSGRFIIIFGVKAETRHHLVLARSKEIVLDLKKWLPWLKEAFEAKGGGSDSLIELALPLSFSLEKIINEVKEKIAFELKNTHS